MHPSHVVTNIKTLLNTKIQAISWNLDPPSPTCIEILHVILHAKKTFKLIVTVRRVALAIDPIIPFSVDFICSLKFTCTQSDTEQETYLNDYLFFQWKLRCRKCIN